MAVKKDLDYYVIFLNNGFKYAVLLASEFSDQRVKVEVMSYSSTGKRLFRGILSANKSLIFGLPGDSYSSGIYIVRVRGASGYIGSYSLKVLEGKK